MQPIPIVSIPTLTPPCFTLRSRRETGTIETANVRHVERWQTDAPLYNQPAGSVQYMDMNPTPSRLYRENLQQSQPFVVPTANSDQVRRTLALNTKVTESLSSIQGLSTELQKAVNTKNLQAQSTLKYNLAMKQDIYKLLLQEQKQIQTDTLSENPYFEKYDVASDSRNIVRELRASVSEDVVDRGVVQSQRLLRRELESRWLPANFAETQGIDRLSAYELMKPKTNNQQRVYWNS